MGNVKNLAKQTMWYGLSSIAARFINYLLTPYLTYASNITTADFGKMGIIYSAIPVLNVLFTYGFETAYFRFSSKETDKNQIYSTAFWSLLLTTCLLSVLFLNATASIEQLTGLNGYPAIIQYAILIIATDTMSAIPFARLRQEGRPIKFAFLKITGILINIFFTWFFVSYCPQHYQGTWMVLIYNPTVNPITYVVLANLIQSSVTLLLLLPEIAQVKMMFRVKLWLQMMQYALPLLIVGFGGIVNETFDRLMLVKWLPGTELVKQEQVGIYNACYKLSILITLFIQAFKMGAEPFFFKQSSSENAPKTYALVMKFFVITITCMFLVVALYLPIWQYFIGPQYRVGLSVVPILLLANMFLGIYYNLSVWYKLGNKTIYGTYITLIGTLVTLAINYLFIPFGGYIACAWATFCCYGTMMVVSFVWGQKQYRIPYAWKKLVAYITIVVLLFAAQKGIEQVIQNVVVRLVIATCLLLLYVRFLLFVERKAFQKLPFIGKFV